jgi:hypothetical protein
MIPLNLPADLLEFLTAGKRLEYDPEDCDPGRVGLLAPDQLFLELFPYHTDSAAMTDDGLNIDDPYRGEDGCYLVEGVNLVGTSDDYGACGRLMWFPLEGCYGIWDGDHSHISVFPPEHTWSVIAADPVLYLNAGWGDLVLEHPPLRPLIPWPRYRYSYRGGEGPFPYEVNASAQLNDFLKDLTGSWTILWSDYDPTNRNPITLLQSGDTIEGTYLNDARESCKVTGVINREKGTVTLRIKGERPSFEIECTGMPASAKVIEGRCYYGDRLGEFRMLRTEK